MVMTFEYWQRDVSRFLSAETGHAEEAFAADANLIREGLVDSLTFVRLIEFAQSLGATEGQSPEVRLEQIDTLRKLYAHFMGSGESVATPASAAAPGSPRDGWSSAHAAIEKRSLISFDGTRIEWLEWGAGEPLVISSAISLPFEFWAPLLERLHRDFRVIFVKRRGLWGTEVAQDLSVEAHARDLAAIVETIGGHYSAIGYCSGALPLIRSFDLVAKRPRALCVLSGRFCRGDAVAARHLARVVADESRRKKVAQILGAFAPASLHGALREELDKPGQLEAQLKAVESSRSYDGSAPLPSGLRVTFVYGEHDYEIIRASTERYTARFHEPTWSTIVLDGASHFYVSEDVDGTERAVRAALERKARSSARGERGPLISVIGGDGSVRLREQDIARLERHGRVRFLEELPRGIDEAERALKGSTVVVSLLGRAALSGALLDRLTELRVVSIAGVTLDNVDVEHAKRRGIVVTTTRGASNVAVAEWTILALLALARRLHVGIALAREPNWSLLMGSSLYGKTLGVVGLGGIGEQVALRAKALGMRVVAASPHLDAQRCAASGVAALDLNALLESSDFVSLHLRLAASTRNTLGARELARMKPSAFLVNSARAALVEEDALYHALSSGRLKGACLDVHSEEPISSTNRFRDLPNVMLLPHMAWMTHDTIENFSRMAVDHAIAGLEQANHRERSSTEASAP